MLSSHGLTDIQVRPGDRWKSLVMYSLSLSWKETVWCDQQLTDLLQASLLPTPCQGSAWHHTAYFLIRHLIQLYYHSVIFINNQYWSSVVTCFIMEYCRAPKCRNHDRIIHHIRTLPWILTHCSFVFTRPHLQSSPAMTKQHLKMHMCIRVFNLKWHYYIIETTYYYTIT